MAPKKDVKRLGSVQPICDCWRVEVSGVGKGPSRATKALAEQDLVSVRAEASRAHMGIRLKQLVKSERVAVVPASEGVCQDGPQAKKKRLTDCECDSESYKDPQSQALLVRRSLVEEIQNQALPIKSTTNERVDFGSREVRQSQSAPSGVPFVGAADSSPTLDTRSQALPALAFSALADVRRG